MKFLHVNYLLFCKYSLAKIVISLNNSLLFKTSLLFFSRFLSKVFHSRNWLNTWKHNVKFWRYHSYKKTNWKFFVFLLLYLCLFKENSKLFGWMTTKLKELGIWNFQESITTRSRECNSSFAFMGYYNLYSRYSIKNICDILRYKFCFICGHF